MNFVAECNATLPQLLVFIQSTYFCQHLPISCQRNFTKFEHNMSIGVAMILSKQNFEYFPVRGRFSKICKKLKFFQRLATFYNSAMIIDRQNFQYQMIPLRDVCFSTAQIALRFEPNTVL